MLAVMKWSKARLLVEAARRHPRLLYGGGGLATVGVFEIYLLRLGAPPLAMVMGIIVGVPMYCIGLVVALHLSEAR
jgi:hypothetical protein